jgi:rod shape-determining protein MreD
MPRICITALILILNLVFQSSIFQLISVRNITPNTAIIIIVSISLLRGSKKGAIAGFFAGFLQDVFFGFAPFYYGFLGALCGYITGKFNKGFYRENYILPILLCSISTFIYESIVFISGPLFNGSTNYIYFLFNLIIPETVYNAILTVVVYRLLFAINSFLEQKEQHKRKLFSIDNK